MSLIAFIKGSEDSLLKRPCLICGQDSDTHTGHDGHRWVPCGSDQALARRRVIRNVPGAHYRLGLPQDRCGVYNGDDFLGTNWCQAEQRLQAREFGSYADGIRAALRVISDSIRQTAQLAQVADMNKMVQTKDAYVDRMTGLFSVERKVRALLPPA